MGSRVNKVNTLLIALLVIGTAGSAHQGYQLWKAQQVNQMLKAGAIPKDESLAYQAKFAAAYQQGIHQDYKHAVQTYSQLLEMNPPASEQARIQFNIGNNLFQSGLKRRMNDDGSFIDEAVYDISQARIAYEQALRLDPQALTAKFNLSLLLSILPEHAKGAKREQAGMELSNLPVGLP